MYPFEALRKMKAWISIAVVVAAALIAVTESNPTYCSYPPACKAPKILHTATCKCVCPTPWTPHAPSPHAPSPHAPSPHQPYGQCVAPRVYDPHTCSCDCPYVPKMCPNKLHIFDRKACKCVCPYIPKCPTAQSFDDTTCTCVCPYKPVCTKAQMIDPETCGCVCPYVPYKCPLAGHVFNTKNCQCECPVTSYSHCPAPKILDSVSCKCKCPHHIPCGKNKVLDPHTCKCVCKHAPACRYPATYDHNTCKCHSTHVPRQPSTCEYATTKEECAKASCASYNHGKQCTFLPYVKRCVCPCCVTAYSPKFTDFCLARSFFQKDSCVKGFCKYVC